MKAKKYASDYNKELLAELYDQRETYSDDVDLLLTLIGEEEELTILEVFSGTGRILIPLLQAGHHVTGLEIAAAMNQRLLQKVEAMGDAALLPRLRINNQDALAKSWGTNEYDLVVLGGNSLYELPSVELQKRCLKFAHQALKPGGKLFVDNDNWKVTLTPAMVGDKWVSIEGVGSDGSYGKEASEIVGIDENNQVMDIKRTWYMRTTDGQESTSEYIGSKHPVCHAEVAAWLAELNFEVVNVFGDRSGGEFKQDSNRAIFWVRKSRY